MPRAQGLERLGPDEEMTSTPRPSCSLLLGEWPGLEMEQARGRGGGPGRWAPGSGMTV